MFNSSGSDSLELRVWEQVETTLCLRPTFTEVANEITVATSVFFTSYNLSRGSGSGHSVGELNFRLERNRML